MFTYSKGYYKLRALEIGSLYRFTAFAGSYSLVLNDIHVENLVDSIGQPS